jgi:hypothetical protein
MTSFLYILYYYYFFFYHTFFYTWYFSCWCYAEPHHSGFKFQIVALLLLRAMFLVRQLFLGNVFNAFLVLFPDFFL